MSVTINGTSGITFNNGTTTSVGALGDGQTWTDVIASRAFATTYTNSTGKPISVYVQGSGASSSMTATVSGVVASGANTTSTACVVCFIVPNGGTYIVAQQGGVSIVRWAELR